MNFIVRILFSGLMAFVPSEDGTELTVLLLNVDHGYHASDGSVVPHHNPIVLARAGGCTGQCPTSDDALAQYLFADQSLEVARDSYAIAVQGGGGWRVNNVDLFLRKGSPDAPELPALCFQRNVRNSALPIPTNSLEREDYVWVSSATQICPTCTLNPAVLSANPPAGLIAARFKLRSGKVFTWSVTRLGLDVAPAHFKRLDGTGGASQFSQALATWVAADIQVSGSSIEIAEQSFNGDAGRSMRLVPDANGRIELAVLNLPPFTPPAARSNATPLIGAHWERYYDLATTPPDTASRFVPYAGAAPGASAYPSVNWQSIHPPDVLRSDLLEKIRMDVSRGPYEQVLCPVAGYP